jgi:hypothetical protein
MAARRLLHWTVEYYLATPQPHVCVILEGRERRGVVFRRSSPVAERILLPIEGDVPTDYRANQALVRRAMRQSRHRWRGRVP